MSTPFGSCPGHDGAPPEILPRAGAGLLSCGKKTRSEGDGEVNQDQDGLGA